MNFVKVSTYIFIVVFAIYVVLIFTILNDNSKKKKILKNVSPCPDSYKISIESEPRKIRCIHNDDVNKSFNSDDYPTLCQKKYWLIKNPDHSWKGLNEYPLKYCSGNLSDNVFRSFFDDNFVFFDDQDEKKRKMKKHDADRNYKFHSKSNNSAKLIAIMITVIAFIMLSKSDGKSVAKEVWGWGTNLKSKISKKVQNLYRTHMQRPETGGQTQPLITPSPMH